MIEDLVGTLNKYFKDKEDILLAFIFGSAASGRLTKDSDVDIAILFSSMPEFQEVLNIRDEISGIVNKDVDVVVLNDSSPIIRMQVLKNGKLIKRKDDVIYNNFYVKTVKEYDDLKYIRKEAEENILRGKIYA